MSVAESKASSRPDSAPARSRRETRRRLLEAGTELFAEGGLHGVTSAQIARGAGVASGTFYLHFKDKHDCFRAIVFDALATLRERQGRAAARAGGDALGQIRARYRELLEVARERRSLIRVLFGRGQEAAELGEDVLDALVPGIEERLRERARADGEAALHPGAAAQALIGMVTRVMAWWVEDPSRAPREAVVDTLTRLHPAVRSPGPEPDSTI